MNYLVYEDVGSGLPKNNVAVFTSKADAEYFVSKVQSGISLMQDDFWFDLSELEIWGLKDRIKIQRLPAIKRDFRLMPRS